MLLKNEGEVDKKMNSLSGFIKLHRKLVAWGWYQDCVVKCLFLHLLLTANFKATRWQNRDLQEGQVVVGLKNLANELGFSVQQIRTAINKLKSTNEITIETTNRYSIITIVNWREYQSDGIQSNKQNNKQSNKQITNNQQTNNKQITNNQQQRKNDKNVKNDKKREKREEIALALGTFGNVLLTEDELTALKQKYPDDWESKIERLSSFMASSGKTYANHYATLLRWLKEDAQKSANHTNPRPRSKSYDINELEKIDTLDWMDE